MSEVQNLSAVLSGVHVALFTPLKDDDPRRLRNSIDYNKAAGMIEDILAAGVDGIVPIGTTGQSPTVTPAQHLDFVRFVIEKVAGRARLIAGAGSNCTRESVDMVKEIQRVAPGTPCLCVTGYYNNPPQQGIVDHFETLAEETGAPLVLYNVPSRTSSYIEPATLIHLARHPLVIGVKQAVDFWSEGNFRQDTISVIEATRDLDFAVVSGEDDGFLPLLEIGGKGIVSATGNIPEAARLYLRMYRSFLAGDLEGAKGCREELLGFVRWVFARKNPIPLGTLFGSPLFLPLVDMARTPGGEEDVERMLSWAAVAAPSLEKWR
ncbi:MAG: 4-hydroxy-tetrahydrodipicolinate synthase [Fibrobacteria bacterium]|nr:4-hydroxy-tetrahydrodipicolinate synthase [Fibrobacteria bacterium]